MARLLSLLLFMFFISFGFAQNSYDIDKRRGKLFLNFGTEYRITLFFKGAKESQLGIPTNIDAQNSGPVLNFNLDLFLTKNFSLGFGNGIRYDVITYDLSQFDNINTVLPTNNDLIFSFHFYADYHFKIFKKSEFFARVGRSLMNYSTEFTLNRTIQVPGNDVGLLVSSSGNYSYGAGHYAIGWKKNKLSLLAGIYTSTTTEYFEGENTFNIPYLSIKYNLGKL
jgi:hypothetical protein